ncbi:hypothetical protein SESBI_06705 [Sesbania bispinosa]|nr:hypothetical protein SESBI_06705 [Sesbania bispinosa]
MDQLSTWSGQASMVQPPTQPSVAKAMFHHLGAPTWVTSWRYPTRHADSHVRSIIKTDLCQNIGDVGLPNAETCDRSKAQGGVV